ncbi:serine hydrolase [Curtobacterium ammoniigenes]|uniref:serine hydrolase n=1 Tax=Curtobacterium ammoniigenes TaxID=395387 RepID=UPI00082FD1CC|nr:serine hydrolase [Curtobacterium ammoniigenes]
MVEPDAPSRRGRASGGGADDRDRDRPRRGGRHRGSGDERFPATIAALGALARDDARVSASVIDTASGRALLAVDERVALPIATLGRLLLLVEVAARLEDGGFHGERLQRMARDAAAGPGLWQFMQEPTMQVADLATLVGATADAWASNALLAMVGLDAVRTRAEALGMDRTAVLDRNRDRRGPDDAPDTAVGSTAELSWLMRGLALGEVVDESTSNRVLGWLSLASDFAGVAGSFGLDPFAHRDMAHGLQAVAATGSAAGVRAEAGVLRGPSRSVSYSVTVAYDDDGLQRRLAVGEALRALGAELLDAVHG